jgi:hypothetical protein
MSKFDILLNEFILLGVEPVASNEMILEAYQHTITEGDVPEEILRNARQTLFKTKSRMQAELSGLLDTPAAQAKSIIACLKSGAKADEIRCVATSLRPLSRLNLLTHVASKGFVDKDLLVQFVGAVSDIDDTAIVSRVAHLRQAAKFVSADEDLVRDTLQAHVESQARLVFSGFSERSVAANQIQACVLAFLPHAPNTEIEALTTLVRGYRQFVEPELFRLQQQIEQSGKKLVDEPSNVTALEDALESLRDWHTLAQPVLRLEHHKGRDDAAGRSVYTALRGFSIAIANDKDRFDVALTLTQALSETFKLLPRAVEQIDEDVKTLDEQVRIRPLKDFVNGLNDNQLNDLAGDLATVGFGPKEGSISGRLFDLYLNAIQIKAGSTNIDVPYLVIRDLAIKINNQLEEPFASRALLEGILSQDEHSSPSAAVIEKLREDRAAVERNIIGRELDIALKSKQNSAAIALIARLIPLTIDVNDRFNLQKLKEKLEGDRNAFYGRIAFFVICGIIWLVSSLSERGQSHTAVRQSPQSGAPYASYDPTAAAPQVSQLHFDTPPQVRTPENDLLEAKPEPGTGLLFTRGNIRYCLFQMQRLEAIKVMPGADFTLAELNSAIDDWNSRCSNYRYHASDLAFVEGQRDEERIRLTEEGRATLASWVKGRTPPSPRIAYAPPTEADFQTAVASPASTFDAVRVKRTQESLIALGHLTGQASGIWDDRSRLALQAFQVKNRLPISDTLDDVSERALSATYKRERAAKSFEANFSGAWIGENKTCPDSALFPEAKLLRINYRRAQFGGSACEFLKVEEAMSEWKIVAQCKAGEKAWEVNVRLKRAGDKITWSSERGTVVYRRCG